MARMKVAVLHKVQDIRIEEREIASPEHEEVLIKIKAVGICGSDFQYYKTGICGTYAFSEPFILGHEAAGEIIKIGAEVAGLKIGDRVAIEPGRTCGRCIYCKTGRYNLCPDVIFLAASPVNGAFSEFLVMPSHLVYKLPPAVSCEEGAMIEPLSVGIHAVDRANLRHNDKIAIFGQGPIGRVTLAVVLAYGISEIFVTDISQGRLDLIDEKVVKINARNQDPRTLILDQTQQDGVDVVFEASGATKSIQDALEVVKRGGKILQIGVPHEQYIPLPLAKIVDNQIDILGSFRYANTYPIAISLLEKKQVNVKKLITHRFSFKAIQDAFEFLRKTGEPIIKIMINFE
ncbi:MAG TPA: NAD(P)-dependent alcohol dehydrogenase [Candidatus Deferrimicrobium sp.]|nr:NAD(P)-dependent alcohol dehydrogenase [Candidatus Deferrimicrobium sp.]